MQLQLYTHRQLSTAARRGGDGEDGEPPLGLLCRAVKMVSQVRRPARSILSKTAAKIRFWIDCPMRELYGS